MATYDRYSQFRQDGAIAVVPFGEDEVQVARPGKIPADGAGAVDAVEFEIPDRVTLRIPYPLSQSIQDYQASIDEHKRLYK